MRLRSWGAVIVAAALTSACGSEPAETTSSPGAAPSAAPLAMTSVERLHASAADRPVRPHKMLPAAPLPGERMGLKGDFYDDVRAANPGAFNITRSAATPVIPAAEFDTKQALLVAWTGSFPELTAGIVDNARQVTDVWIVHEGTQAKSQFQQYMTQYGVSTAGLTYLDTPNDSLWIRDFGPISVYDADTKKPGLVDPRYYHQRVWDDSVPHVFGNTANLTTYKMPVDFEGGNFMSDGRGTCVVSQGVLWFNPSVSEAQIRKYFREYLGCFQLIIVNPLQGEGTTHIDMFTKLVDHDTVLLGSYTTQQDATNRELMNDNEDIYNAVVLADAQPLDVVRMPMPGNWDGAYRTYINSQFINGVNLVPVYTDTTTYEAEALAIWEQVMPGWSHVPLDATDIIQWSGAIHCILMEVQDGPAGAIEGDPADICNNANCYPTSGGGNAGCGNVPVYGACSGATANWCDFGAVQTTSCDSSCGWVWEAGHFGCGDGPGCEPDCAGKACGLDGCGGSCGECGNGLQCQGSQCVADPTDCGSIGYRGCCDGTYLKFCDNGELTTYTCGSQGCGWQAGAGYYNCGQSGQDPTGEFPLACDDTGCTPDCAGKACGVDGCGGTCGQCGGGETCTAAGQCEGGCVPDCAGKVCGSDGCSGSCGGCAAGETCNASGQCVADCVPSCEGAECGPDGCDGMCGTCPGGSTCDDTGHCISDCTPDCDGKACGSDSCGGQCGVCAATEICQENQCVDLPQGSCGDISWEGVCDNGVVTWCNQQGELEQTSCNSGCCGWLVDQDYYWCYAAVQCQYCYNECGLGESGCSALGSHQWTCQDSTDDWPCRTRVYTPCPGGCDGDTGACNTTCAPSCAGKTCGDDDCGGSCGSCPNGELCSTVGTCEPIPCVPSCAGKQCGSDGCDGLCGSCGSDEECNANGQCVPGVCVPLCEGKACGSDGCGGECGACGDGELCSGAGQCIPEPCVPQCSGKVCGPDTCGGLCGTCAAGQFCQAGACEDVCVPACDGKSCGADGCGGVCGACADGETCTDAGACVAVCVPACDGKTCGSNGCGGTCGVCPDGQACTDAGACAAVAGCGNIPSDGICQGSVLTWCQGSIVKSTDCAADGKVCDLVVGSGYLCVADDTCTPECGGKQCGPDGCGGVCGSCPAGQACGDAGTCEAASGCGDVTYEGSCEGDVVTWCQDGQLQTYDCSQQDKTCGFVEGTGNTCVEGGVCVPQCGANVCGDDGCGGSCGVCGAGTSCDGGQCVPGGAPDAGGTPDSGGTPDAGGKPDTGTPPQVDSGPVAPGTDAQPGTDVPTDPVANNGSNDTGCTAVGSGPNPLVVGLALLGMLGLLARRRRTARL